jgi:hypothetical protein
MKTIAQELKIKDFPFEIRDKNNNQIYYEYSNGYWVKREFDSKNNIIYCETSNGYWIKQEYDSNNKEIYWENSYGTIINNRPKTIPEFTMEELVAKLGYNFKIKK